MTDDQIKAECEARFQAGGTRAQIVDAQGQFVRYAHSAAGAKWSVDHDQRVFARRKVRIERRYEWKQINTSRVR